MTKRLLIVLLATVCGACILGGCSQTSEGPAEQTKPLTDAEFEKSIENAPEQAKVSARAEREKAKALMQQGDAPKK
jgi:hypothetical protein